MSRKIAFYFFLLLFLIHLHMTTYALERETYIVLVKVAYPLLECFFDHVFKALILLMF